MKTAPRFALSVLLCAAGAAPLPALAAMLELPCTGVDGQPVPGTEVVALLADHSGDEVRTPGENGRCRIELKPGVYLVKAESPDRRSVPSKGNSSLARYG
ncbi:hypothetical protein ACFJGW_02605 [Burkholderiaceae bacterium UC74_6]